ncbi:hypothetical protein [Pseudosulfitobacter koreensis]|uniref:Uncharacterized protein n=1 Tax=Pseudosulfitobacter koreensis TaxID=2968472 RepID=A0ABT1YZU8_9RHOB|nr:hypothetical protein [Pseudosulfitobacter koreense]MCR8826412.1 hypothetical protein [Pseudosulfitobacter koreense]
MPITLGLIVVGMIVYFVLLRVRRGSRMVAEVIDMPSDVRTAARRLGYKRRTDVHPVQGIDDPQLALGTLAVAYLSLGKAPTPAAPALLKHDIAQDAEQARSMVMLGRWLIRTCDGTQDAVTRVARRLRALDGGGSVQSLSALMQDGEEDETPAQTAARTEVEGILRPQ